MANFQTRQKVRKSLRLSIFDGAAGFAMAGLTQNYITPFALALKATTAQIGLLNSLPNFAVAFAQLFSPGLVDIAGTRKRVILPTVFIHALLWLPVFLLPYLFPGTAIWWLIGLYTLSIVFGAVANAPWGSMMADLVHEDVRGRYFSFRGRINTFTTLAFSLLAGLLLQLFTHNVFIGFGIIFGGAIVCRLLSFNFLSRMYEPPMIRENRQTASLGDMVKHLTTSNFGRFVIFVSLMFFAIMFSGAFFSVYMLRDLKLSYLVFTIINSASTVTTLIFLPYWGRRADRAGNLKILKITGTMMPLIPLLWLVSTNPVYLVLANAFSGFIWSGFDLSCSNFLFDASAPETRTKQIALFNCIVNVTLAIGALAGGLLAPHLPALLGYQLRSLFTLSGILRAVAVVLVLGAITEVRHVPKINTLRLLFGRTNYDRNHKKIQAEGW
jgi:MFS family permease